MLLNFDLFKKHKGLQAYFSQKKDGSMKLTGNPEILKKISRNRSAYFFRNSINPAKIVSAEIAHGDRIKIIGSNDGGKIIRYTDGLISRNKNLYFSITSADCLPIFLFEPKKGIIGMIHAGWRSLGKNVLRNAIGKIKNLGGAPENILVGIGPAICQKHYEVGSEVAKKFAKYPEAIKREENKLFLDIKKVAELQLLGLGLLEENIEISSKCTLELSKRYFSARRDRPKEKEVEAMIAVIGIRK